jgi:cation diffusion facilitator CzcD-associated flavoprotein CzcO
VTVFDRTPDVGGVWSRTRRYPGLTTQNGRGTYSLSEFPMPSSYPEWPTGEQVQQYLHAYAAQFGLFPSIRLETEVEGAELDEQTGTWTLRTRDVGTGAANPAAEFDHLVVANGIFSEPSVPDYPGVEEFTAAGGRLCHASEFTDLEDARDRDVLVVGYGKSSCDVAVALSEVARSTNVVTREVLWKMPRRLGGVVNYKYLLLTRLGEGLFRYVEPNRVEAFLHGPGKAVRDGMLGSIQSLVVKQLKLTELGLVPEGSLERIARSTVSLASDGFFEAVADGTISVRRECRVEELLVLEGRPVARLSDGSLVPADVVVCGTGFRQRVPFLSERNQARLQDERGNFELYRQILPHDLPSTTFCGYNSSFFSPLSAEVAAWWIAEHLAGGLDLPPLERRRAHVAARLRWMEQRTEGKHARGTNIIPFSIHNIDEMLSDLGVGVGALTRFSEWLVPLRPNAYAALSRRLRRRHPQASRSLDSVPAA